MSTAAAADAPSMRAVPPNRLIAFYRSSIGKKWIVALTGLVMVGFVVVHLIGNLQIFLPPAYINAYAAKLKSLGPVLWLFRISLFAAFVLHVINTIQLSRMNRVAKGERYVKEATVQATVASRTMFYSGLILLAFIIFHILHFTLGWIPTENIHVMDYAPEAGNAKDPLLHNVWKMLVGGFRNPFVSVFYLVSMGLLCMHLSHGVESTVQTLGLRTKPLARPARYLSWGLGWAVFLGNAAIVLAILFGFIK